ncbi:MAG: tRNA glutamyl-Q(34) synthetase GluQRS [Alphaproteobacteria bacterium]|nr:tRNA glutamyl-Q(34) synthetase GluQRS [Alphaproteobacteria bacterium]
MPETTRFAPSPTGYLHLGTAKAALFAAAEANGGRFLVRIENIDHTRCRPEFETAMLEGLAWLGLCWEKPVRRQSEHMASYSAATRRLQDMNLLYPCFCTRADIARAGEAPHGPAGPDGPIYPGTCRSLTVREGNARIDRGEAYALRLRTDDATTRAGTLSWIDLDRGEQTATPEIFGDVVIARKDVPTSYHLACTWDDAEQGVSLVTRGEELFPATHVHRLLQHLLALPTPRYRHHGLVLGADGKKLSKRDRALDIRSLREAGHTPAQVIDMAMARASPTDCRS